MLLKYHIAHKNPLKSLSKYARKITNTVSGADSSKMEAISANIYVFDTIKFS